MVVGGLGSAAALGVVGAGGCEQLATASMIVATTGSATTVPRLIRYFL
jgi:hypothetical protein